MIDLRKANLVIFLIKGMLHIPLFINYISRHSPEAILAFVNHGQRRESNLGALRTFCCPSETDLSPICGGMQPPTLPPPPLMVSTNQEHISCRSIVDEQHGITHIMLAKIFIYALALPTKADFGCIFTSKFIKFCHEQKGTGYAWPI